MAGYRTVDELMDILEEECLEFDAVVRSTRVVTETMTMGFLS